MKLMRLGKTFGLFNFRKKRIYLLQFSLKDHWLFLNVIIITERIRTLYCMDGYSFILDIQIIRRFNCDNRAVRKSKSD